MSLWSSSGAGSRLAAAGAGSSVGRVVSSSRVAVFAQARPGYEQPRRPSRSPSQPAGAWDMAEDEEDFPASRPANNPGQQGGYRGRYQSNGNGAPQQQQQQPGEAPQEGTYRPRRQYNQNRGDGQGQYNRPEGGQYNRPEGGQYNRGGQYNDGSRRQYAPRGEGDAGQQGGQQRQPYINPRQSLPPELLAARDETNRQVMNARGYEAIGQLLEERSSTLDAEHISSLWRKIANEQRPLDPEAGAAFDRVLSSLLGWALSLMPTFKPRHTSRTLAALGKMQLYSPEVVGGLVERAASQMGNFDDRDLGSMIQALGQLGQSPSAAFQAQFFERTTGKFASLRILDFSNLLQGMLKLNMHTSASPEWLQGCFNALQAKLLELPTSVQAHMDLSNRAKEQPSSSTEPTQQQEPAAAAEAGQPQQPQPTQERPQRPARRQYYPRRQQDDPNFVSLDQYVELVLAAMTFAKDTGYTPEQELVDALFTRQGWRLQNRNWLALSKVLWAATNLPTNRRPHPQWVVAVDRALASNDRSWDAETLPTICLYFSRYLGAAARPQLCDRLAKFVDANRPTLGVEGMAPILYTLGTSGYKPADRVMDMILVYLQQNAANCSITSLELLYTALPGMGEGNDYRLNQVYQDIQARYTYAIQQAQQYAEAPQQEGEAAAATVA